MRMSSAAISKRRKFRRISAYQFSSFRPNVVGSAWMPWVRPTVGVCLNSMARRFSTSRRRENVFAQNRGRRLQLQCLRGVHHVIRSESVVQPARFGTDLFGYRRSEGDDIVADFGFNLLNARNVNGAALADGFGGR